MRKQRILTIVALLLFAILLTSCSSISVKPPEQTVRPPRSTGEEPLPSDPKTDNCQKAPDIQGSITEVTDSGDTLRILVDAQGELEDSVKGEIWVTIPEDVTYAERVSQTFEVGNMVTIVSNGEIMESYPMQTTAMEIRQNEK